MTGWLKKEMRRALKREEQKFVDSMRPKVKTVWKVPPGAPCWNCIQNPGDTICQNKCPYYEELTAMRDRGDLLKVTTK